MSFVLDASVALAWAFEDEAEGYAEIVLAHLGGGEALVPALWLLEISHGLLAAERRARIAPSDAVRFSSLLLALPIVVEPPDRRRIFETTPSWLVDTGCRPTMPTS